MKVYVAGSSEELERVVAFEELLVEHGFEVASTWRHDVEERGCGNPASATRPERRHWATKDATEILTSDAFVLLVPGEAYTHGGFYELGFAEAAAITTVCVGNTKRSIFCAVADGEFEQDSEAIAFLCGVRKETE